MYKYIAIDFDGTMLGSNHDVSLRTIKVLRRLQKRGIIVIPCSGRNISQMDFAVKKIGCENYNTFVVSDNGGAVTKIDKGKRTLIRNGQFSQEELANIIKLVRKDTNILVAFKDGKRYMEKFNAKEQLRVFLRFRERIQLGMPEVASKILLVDKVPHINHIYDDVKTKVLDCSPNVNVFRSVPTLIEITPEGSTKGQGLKMIFEKQGWNLDELICFGDGENDISMFEVAGKSVAMENGFDTVKSIADDVCLPNDHDGVAIYLEHLYEDLLKGNNG